MSFKNRLRQILDDGKAAAEESRNSDTWSPQSWRRDIQRALEAARDVLKDELQGSDAGVTGDNTSRTLTVRVNPVSLWDLRDDPLLERTYTLSFRADDAEQTTTVRAKSSHGGAPTFSEKIPHGGLALETAEKRIEEFVEAINADLEELRRQLR